MPRLGRCAAVVVARILGAVLDAVRSVLFQNATGAYPTKAVAAQWIDEASSCLP